METRNQILGKHQTFYFILLFIFIFLHTKHFRQRRQLWGGDRWEGLQKGGAVSKEAAEPWDQRERGPWAKAGGGGWTLVNLQAVVPQHSAGCGGEAEGEGSRSGKGVGWVVGGCCGVTVGAGAITVFFLGCQALTPGRWLPLQVRLPAAQGASWGPPALAPWPSSTGQPIRTRGSAVTSALPAPPPALASATVLG